MVLCMEWTNSLIKSGDPRVRSAGLRLFTLLPAMLLRPLDHGGRGRAQQERSRRFQLFRTAHFEVLLHEAREQAMKDGHKRQQRHEARPDISALTRDPEELEYWEISRSLSL